MSENTVSSLQVIKTGEAFYLIRIDYENVFLIVITLLVAIFAVMSSFMKKYKDY